MSKWQVLSYERGTLKNMDARYYNTLDEARKQQALWLATKPDTYIVNIEEIR